MYDGMLQVWERWLGQRSSPYCGFAPGLYVKPMPVYACYGQITNSMRYHEACSSQTILCQLMKLMRVSITRSSYREVLQRVRVLGYIKVSVLKRKVQKSNEVRDA